MAKRPAFLRSRQGRVLGGVCAGAARRYGWPVWRVRILWLIFALIPVLPGLPAYLLLWILTPLGFEKVRVGEP